MFKKIREKKKIYSEDRSILREKYYLYKDIKDELEEMVFLVTDKIFLIEADTSDEFNEKYNNFILKAREYLSVFCKKHNTTVNEILKWL